MVNRIQYDDYNGALTEIFWYRIDDIDTNYKTRVIEDGGTVESMSCVYDSLAKLIGYYDFDCAGDTPLVYRWHGDRYESIRGSEIKWNVIIKNETDQAELKKMLIGGYYCYVQKDGVIQWVGKVFPQFFTEAYRQYPYEIELNASDQLGQLKQYHFLMLDFPDPFISDAPKVKLLDVINLALTSPEFKPSSSLPTAPDTLRISCRLWHLNEGEMFEDTYIDPLVFMDENDQYIDKSKMLDAILEPLHMKLFQWQGVWYLMSIDAQWDNAKWRYIEYNINYTGWIQVGKFTDVDEGILDLYTNPVTPYPDNRQVFNDAQLEFLPSWQGVNMIAAFEKNNNIIPVYANTSGNWYQGGSGQFLEFGPKFNGVTILTHWEDYTSLSSYYPSNNASNLGVKVLQDHRDDVVANKTFQILGVDNKIKTFVFSFNYDHAVVSRDEELRFNIKYTKGGVTRWAYNDGDGVSWKDEPRTLVIELEKGTGAFSYSASMERPLDEITSLDSEIFFEILVPIFHINPDQGTSGNAPYWSWFNNFRFGAINPDWEAIKYKQESAGIFNPTIINPLGSQPPISKNYTWGLAHTTLNNDHLFHLSTPYTSLGEPIKVFLKTGSVGEFPDYNRLLDWLLLNYSDDNSTITNKLTAKYRSKDITPIRIVMDYDKTIYQFVNGEFDDKRGFWSCEYVEFKGIRNVPGEFNPCDFSLTEFNNDFCFEYLPLVAAYVKRVEADGGTVESIDCVNEALLNLMK